MNEFLIEIKHDGIWEKVDAIFPLATGELLDERLSEGQIVFFSDQKHYAPSSEVRISRPPISEPEYYVSGRDRGVEYPAGSHRYKHEMYIIERIKLLDGVLCSSITFTNAKGRTYKKLSGNVIPATSMYRDDGFSDPIQLSNVLGVFISPIPDIAPTGETVTLPSCKTVGDQLAIWLNRIQDVFIYTPVSSFTYIGTVTSKLSAMGESTTDWNGTLSLTPEASFSVSYECLFSTGEGVTGHERISFTAEVRVLDKRKALARYTITDCIVRVLELAFPLRGQRRPKYTFDGIIYDDGVSSITPGSQADQYSKIFAPEFTMTQSTLREQLRVIGSYIHAEPWLDDNNVVRYRKYGSSVLSAEAGAETPYISHVYSTDINQYCTDIRSNAQNLVSSLSYAKGCITEPGGGLYRSLRSETVNVRVNEETGEAETTSPIYSIPELPSSVKCGIADSGLGLWAIAPQDITPYIVEYAEYSRLSSYAGSYPDAKEYAIYYSMGEKNLKGLFYRAAVDPSVAAYQPFAISNILSSAAGIPVDEIQELLITGVAKLVFQITYQPISSAFVSHGKQKYSRNTNYYAQIFNQGENQVESSAYGEGIKGVSARLGNVEQERTYIFPEGQSLPRVGECIEEDGSLYSISAVSSEMYPFYTKTMLGLSLKFERISEYVGINSVKRMYEVSERETQERQILMKELVIITSDGGLRGDIDTMFNSAARFISPFYSEASGKRKGSIKFASFKGFSKSGAEISNQEYWLPCIGRAFGNSVHFSFRMQDNYSAGASVKEFNENGVSGWIQQEEPYSDYYGRAYWANIKLADSSGMPLGSNGAFTLPAVKDESVPVSITYAADTGSRPHRLRKDGREIISYNIEVEYKTTDDDIIIGSALAELCDLINDTPIPNIVTYLTNKPINVLSQYYLPEQEDKLGGLELNPYREDYYIRLSASAADISLYKYWVICTEFTEEEEEAVNEDGDTVSVPITTGGKILIAGSLGDSFNESGDRILYFRIKGDQT